MNQVKDLERDRSANKKGAPHRVAPRSPSDGFRISSRESERLCDLIYEAVLSELEDAFAGPNGLLGQGLLEAERRWIARGVVARVFLGSSPQLDWQS